MELDEKLIDAHWTKDANGKPQFFIINEAIISKLCILGENCEPCFEGAQITKFSLDENFKVISKKYLGDQEKIAAAMNAVANQGKAKK